MERKFLEDLELEKDVIDSIMAEHGKGIENAKTKAGGDLEAITAERDTLLNSLEDVKKELSEISGKAEGSEEAKKQIEELQNQLADQDAEYKKTIADKDFNYSLTQALMKAGAKDEKIAKAGLDLETLRTSKNQESDIIEAVTSLKEAKGFLFGEEESSAGNVDTGGSHEGGTEPDPLMDAFRVGAGLSKGE